MTIDDQTMTTDEPRSPSRRQADVAWLYRLSVRREAESAETVQALADWARDDLIRGFFSSPEFVEGVGERLSRGARPWPDDTDGPPAALLDWAAEALPLSPETAAGLAEAGATWSGLYLALVSDPLMAAVLGPDTPLLAPERLATLRRSADLAGRLEQADFETVRGWALSVSSAGRPTLELWVDGAFAAAALPDRFRRDVQDRFGGASARTSAGARGWISTPGSRGRSAGISTTKTGGGRCWRGPGRPSGSARAARPCPKGRRRCRRRRDRRSHSRAAASPGAGPRCRG